MDSDDVTLKLVNLSLDARQHSYAPYSHFPVGAAILTDDDKYYSGCNVENACFPLGICAEQCVIGKAVSEGHRKFKAIAISSTMTNTPIVPCGACRQFMAEFGMDIIVHMTRPNGTYISRTVRELLPLGFEPQTLTGEERLPVGSSETDTPNPESGSREPEQEIKTNSDAPILEGIVLVHGS